MTKPTAAALKAADQIVDKFEGAVLNTALHQQRVAIATLIDTHTGLPELIEKAEAAVRCMDAPLDKDSYTNRIARELKAALAKAGHKM